MRAALLVLALVGLLTPMARAQMEPHQHHHPLDAAAPPAAAEAPAMLPTGQEASGTSHNHGDDLGPAGLTYDLRWLDAMVQHHTGALRMSTFVFDIGAPGVGALAKQIWRDQASEIKAMGQWRKAWYPQAPVYPVVLGPNGNPDAMADLIRMSPARIQAMQMLGSNPSTANRVIWFLEGMLQHHGGALIMAHDALTKSSNPTLRRLAREIIVAQRREIIQLRGMLRRSGLNQPTYYRYDNLFQLN